MFDDLKNEPEDMFAQTDKAAPKVTSPTDSAPAPAPETPKISSQPEAVSEVPTPTPAEVPTQAPPSPPSVEDRVAELRSSGGEGIPWKSIVIIFAIIVVVGAAFFISMKILTSRTPTTPEAPVLEEVKEVEEVEEIEGVEKDEEEEVIEQEDDLTDSDKDGLTDVEEEEYGTSPRSEDTDGDGLFDYEEVNTWGSNPLKADTDGDGYLDGEEVDNGYDPNGGGSLLTVPSKE